VRGRLDAFLTERDGLPPAELECEARDLIAGATRDSVEVWRGRWHSRLKSSYGDLVERQQGLLQEASGDLHAAALEHLGVRLRGDVPVLREPDLPALSYDFEPEVGWNHAWVSGARTRVPARIGRRRVEKYVRGEATRLVDKHLGRARAEFQERLENAGRLLQAQVAEAFADLTDGLRTGQQAALEIRLQSAPGQDRERRGLAHQRRALSELADNLRNVAAQPDETLLSAGAGQRPLVVSPGGSKEESP
jgi:hypothetical protein